MQNIEIELVQWRVNMANYTLVPKAFPNLQKMGRLSVRSVVPQKPNGKQAFSIFIVALPADENLRADLYGNTTNNHISAYQQIYHYTNPAPLRNVAGVSRFSVSAIFGPFGAR